MKVFLHHIYEYEKGVRKLILHTLPVSCKARVLQILTSRNISFVIREIENNMFNVFFGKEECITVIKHFGDKPLNKYTLEEDFILGSLLGYDIIQQCKRYIKRTNKNKESKNEKCKNFIRDINRKHRDCSAINF